MLRISFCIAVSTLLYIIPHSVAAQKQKAKPQKQPAKANELVHAKEKADPATNEKRVKGIITFLEFVLNTLGNNNTSTRDKDVLINESYSKIFRDAKVQVEDDLDEERGVVTNKDVVAYLKDINFFFKEIKFEFTIDKIDQGTTSGNHDFYKVSLHRNLNGTTVDGKTVNNSIPRFIEVNFNPKDQDLKIVSIYTHEINEKDAMQNWWAQLSYEWQTIFKMRIGVADSATLNDIKKITSIEELSLANNKYIQSFEPLSQFKNLKALDLSFTLVNDLAPIRNLTELRELNLSNTLIKDLSPLKYSSNLEKLNLSDTEVNDISTLQRMPKLSTLNLNRTKVTDISPVADLSGLTSLNLKATSLSEISALENLTQLTELNISNTTVKNLSPLKGLKNLSSLICDSTKISNISSLASVEHLKVLEANHTLIADLQPLQNLHHLEKIYCDQTPIKKNTADAFMALRPKVLVVYDSYDLKSWWDALSNDWQEVISKAAGISHTPLKEELARIDNVDSINVSGKIHINDFTPLKKFPKLRVVVANKTAVGDLSPIREHRDIQYLDVSETNVIDLSPVSQFKKIKTLKADRCKIESINALKSATSLEKLFLDETGVNDINALEFLESNSKCLLIYKTVHLNRWWKNLSENWKTAFKVEVKDTTRESLHKLVEQEVLHIKDAPVTDLSGLSEFIRLKELHVSGTSITSIIPVDNLKSLRYLKVSDGPILISETIGQLTELEELDISNTPTEDLTPI
ncbi:MAG TPA: leucine-rich repeat domain-containing protein, partial [Cyclobacteriaceae bacterium]|nr:leucine-rich repeat domain-containing protein [Cyclobacteriaceae bacterium]